MNQKWKIIFIVTAGIMVSSTCMAGNPADWSFSIETTGQYASWTSTTHINPAFKAYDCKYTLTNVQIDVNGTWMDYSGISAIDPNGGASSYEGLPVSAYRWYDTNEFQASLSVWADSDGTGHVAVGDVVFGTYNNQPIKGLKVSGTIHVIGLRQLWVDSFDTYGAAMDLNKSGIWTAPWTTYNTTASGYDPCNPLPWNVRSLWAGSNYGNRANYQNDFYCDDRRVARVSSTSVLGLYNSNHVRFKVDAWDTQVNQDNVANSWWLMGRYTSASKLVAVGVQYGGYDASYYNDDGRRPLYVKVFDVGGTGTAYDSGDYFLTYADPAKPITLDLDFDANNVTAHVSHDGASVMLTFVTTVTGGKPGIGAWNSWGYAYGQFDDFAIYTNEGYNPTDCSDSYTYHPQADINKDCQVDFLDFADFALDWLKCTDPTNSECQ
jgi:hypothetical protein